MIQFVIGIVLVMFWGMKTPPVPDMVETLDSGCDVEDEVEEPEGEEEEEDDKTKPKKAKKRRRKKARKEEPARIIKLPEIIPEEPEPEEEIEIAQLASRLNVKPEEVAEMETRLSGGDVALEGRIDDGEEEFAPIDYLADAESEPTQVLQRRQYDVMQTEGVREALDQLDPRSRRIIEARWLNEDRDGRVGTATLHDLADEFGVSAERIRQIEAKALQKMRGSLAEYA